MTTATATDLADAGSEPTGMSEERQNDLIEVIATILLGLAAVAIAWSTYQSALWGGIQDTALTTSANTTTEASDLLQAADTIFATDQTLFIALLTSGACDEDGDAFVCDQIKANLSADGAIAVENWFDNDDVTPFDSSDYIDALYSDGNQLMDAAATSFTEAGVANGNGDDYELSSTLFTIVLFFAGVSIVLSGKRVRMALLGVGGLGLLGTAIYMLTLPMA